MTAERTAPVALAQIDVRTTDPAFLPFEAPEPNTVVAWNGRDVLWLGPDEWLVVGPSGAERELVAELEASLGGHHRSVVVVSAARTAFDITGGREFLMSDCGLDLDPTRWMTGMCAQTLFGPVPVLLHQLDEHTTRVFARASSASDFLQRLAWWVAITG